MIKLGICQVGVKVAVNGNSPCAASGSIPVPPPVEDCDDFFDDVALLLHMDGPNGSTTFVDSSGNNFPLSAVGSTAISDVNVKFGTGSMLGEAITTNITGSEIGMQDFTYETWVTYEGENQDILVLGNGGLGFGGSSMYYQSGNLNWADGSVIVSTPVVTAGLDGTLKHVAIVREAGVLSMYVEGILQDSGASTENHVLGDVVIGSVFFVPSTYVYQDEARLTVGVARYTAPFTPSIKAFANEACAI